MMRFYQFLFVLLSLCISTFGQIPSGYYNSANGFTGLALKQKLHDIIDNHNVQSYNSLLSHYQNTDKKSNGKVWDMYSDNPGNTPPYEYSFGSNCGSYSGEGDCYNREHSFPQSWFGSNSPMVSDLFHVYPTDGYVNGRRSNYPYADVTNPSWTSQNGSKLGPSITAGYSGTAFEPIDSYKGDFARTYFYMAARYYSEDSGWPGSAMTDGAEPKPWAIELLKKWHQKDTVSQKEINRNNAVYLIQKNRNPFIDHPEYVYSIWGNLTNTISEEIKKDLFTIFIDEKNNLLIHSEKKGEINFYLHIYTLTGILLVQTKHNSETYNLSLQNLSNGIYIINVITGKTVFNKKVVIIN